MHYTKRPSSLRFNSLSGYYIQAFSKEDMIAVPLLLSSSVRNSRSDRKLDYKDFDVKF